MAQYTSSYTGAGIDSQLSKAGKTGATQIGDKLFIIGAATQSSDVNTYSKDVCWLGTDGHVYSNSHICINNGGGQTINGSLSLTGNLNFSNGCRISHPDAQNNILYIGTQNNKGWVQFQDICSQSGKDYWKIQQTGAISCVSLTQTSDIRSKNIDSDFIIPIDRIAEAPLFKFTWKDSNYDKELHIGTSAQYWKDIVPELVSQDIDKESEEKGEDNEDGLLSLQYGVLGVATAISTAKKVVELEKEVENLKQIIAEINDTLNKK